RITAAARRDRHVGAAFAPTGQPLVGLDAGDEADAQAGAGARAVIGHRPPPVVPRRGSQPRICQSSSPSYSGFALARTLTRSRSAATSAFLPPASAVPMTSATSRNSSAPNPRVASAGVPIRRPEVTIGGRGSNGTALRLTVIP